MTRKERLKRIKNKYLEAKCEKCNGHRYIDDMVFCLFDDGVAAWSKYIHTDKYVHIGEFD